MRTSILSTISLALLLTAACGKSGPSGSGAMSTAEKSLLEHLPADANMVFGGDVDDLVNYAKNSPLKDLPGMGSADDYGVSMDCWKDVKDVTFVGSASIVQRRLRIAMKGATIEQMEACAKTMPGATARRAEDGKFFTVAFPAADDRPAGEMTYHFINADTAYMVIAMDAGNGGQPVASLSIDQLKADVARAQKSSLVTNAPMMALAGKVDRKSALWMCGDVTGTPAAESVELGCASVGATADKLTLDFFAKLSDPEMGKMAVKQFEGAKSQLDKIPAQMQSLKDAAESLLDAAKLKFDDGMLIGHFELENDVIKPLIGMASMLGALAR